MKKIAVVGSCSMDFTVTTYNKPHSGETVIGHSFTTAPGGKGANQAVAASRLGGEVYMIGCVGDDYYGREILTNLNNNHVHTEYVQCIGHTPSGTAHITVEHDGSNQIVIVQGANRYVTPRVVESARDIMKKADMVLIQQEIPEETVESTIELCSELSLPIILNPAPSRPISLRLIEKASYLTPNEHEATLLGNGLNAYELLSTYPHKVVITEGERGVSYWNEGRMERIPTHHVHVVDTTGAGDTFNGAFAVALTEGRGLRESLRFANAAAALSVRQLGAQDGMPKRTEVKQILTNTTT